MATSELELRVAARRLHGAAALATPGVQLAEDAFVDRLVAAVIGESDPLAALEALHAADLYLAHAAASGEGAALVAVDHRLRAQVEAVVRSLGESRGFADDLESQLREHVLAPRDAARPRLASYSGRGALDGWLRVTAMREALRARRRHAVTGFEDELLRQLPDRVTPELDYLKTVYRDQVATAFRGAIGALDARQQNLIKLHYGDGVGIEDLGRMYRVHFSTISRWIAAARDTLHDATRAAVRAHLAIDDREFDEIMDLVRSRLDVTISLFVRR